MTGPSGSQKKPPVLLREDSKYALEKLSSIIISKDYEDLCNHSMEAMGETALFSIAQAMIMAKGIMERCLNHETTIDCLRDKAKATEDELLEFKSWKVVQEKKLKMAESARDEYMKLSEDVRKALEKKDAEVRQAKEVAIREYRDSEALITELSVSYNDGFDDAIRQVKALNPELDLLAVNIDAPEQTSAQPAQSDDTDDLFGENPPNLDAPKDPKDSQTVVIQTVVSQTADPKDDQARAEKKDVLAVDG